MEAKRIVDVLTASRSRAERGLTVALETRNAELAALNFRRLFHLNVQHGLMEWRAHSAGLERLLAGVSVAEQALQLLPSLHLSPLLAFPLAPACAIATLARPNSALMSAIPHSDERSAETFLALVLCGEAAPRLLIDYLQQQNFPPQQALWRNTLQVYAELLAGGNPASLVPEAETLFSRRAYDRFFSEGEAIYGGGANNQLVPDFWLAAIMQHICYEGSSQHRWVGA